MSSLVNADQVLAGSTFSTPADTAPPAQHEIDQLQQRIIDLERELNTDQLTGIANRRALTAYTERLSSLAVIALVDVDQFKPINDTHGHHVGDVVLREVAHRLRAALAGRGSAARLGGDEFTLVITHPLPGVDLHDTAHRTLLAALRLVAAPLAVSGQIFTVKTSIGAALTRDNEPFAVTLHRADVAMYRAKRARAGMAFHDPKLDCPVAELAEKPILRVRDLPTDTPLLRHLG